MGKVTSNLEAALKDGIVSAPDVRETSSFQYLSAIIPFSVSGSLIAAAVLTFLGYPILQVPAVCLVLALLFALMWKVWLPRVRTPLGADLLAWAFFWVASCGNFAGAYWNLVDASPMSQALVAVIAALAFSDTRVYASFLVVGALSHVVSRLMGDFELDANYVTLLLLSPLHALIIRVGVLHLRRRVDSAMTSLQQKVRELEMEKSLRAESDRRLAYAEKMEGIGLLATGVAHDFNNHLQAISSVTELMEIAETNPQQKGDYCKLIRSATREAAEICQRMLAYAGKTKEELEPVDLIALLKSSGPILNAMVAPPATIEILMPESEGALTVKANATALNQCINNLVRNSLESFLAKRGHIVVRVFQQATTELESSAWHLFGDHHQLVTSPNSKTHLVLEVTDDGCGIREQDMEHIFDPYFTTKENGNGFGLSTALGLVRSFGGVMRCKSQEGFGTSMQILLPRFSGILDKVEDGRKQEHAKIGFSDILLVEDDDSVRQSTQEMLELAGFQVIAFGDPQDALVHVREHPRCADIMIVDYLLPHMNGLEFLERVRAEGILTATILCSGVAESTICDQEAIRPDAFVKKPFVLSGLLDVFRVLDAKSRGG